jgi:hypothetical protein
MTIKKYRTIILPFVLYGCGTWSLTLSEKHRLKVFENRVLRRTFGAKRDEVTWKWRKLQNEQLNDLYCSPNIARLIKSRKMRWVGHVARMGDTKGVVQGLEGKHEGKRPIGRTGRWCEDNIKMNFQDVVLTDMDWIDVIQDMDSWRMLL